MDDDLKEKYAEMALAINVGDDDDIEKGKKKGIDRFAKLTLLEKFIIYRYDELIAANGELETKYNTLATSSTELKENFEAMKTANENEINKLRKENAKLKKGKIILK